MKPKTFEDILDDFSFEARMRYAEHIAPYSLAELAAGRGDDWVYFDLVDFLLAK